MTTSPRRRDGGAPPSSRAALGTSSRQSTHLSASDGGAPIEALAVALLLGVVVVTRALDANRFITWDEPAWVYRSVHFLLALLRGDPEGTALTGHPGVTTTWLGALGLAWRLWVARTITWAQVAAVGALPTLEVHDAGAMRLMAALLPAAKSALPLAHAAIALAIYGLLRRLTGRGVAVLGLLLLALDPYYLALSRVLHIDALASGLMLASALGVLLHVRLGEEERSSTRRALILSGAAAGLATLTKTYGVFVTPFAVGVLAANALRPRMGSVAGGGARDLPRRGPSLRSGRRRDASASPRDVSGAGGERGARSRWVALGCDAALWAAAAVAAFAIAWPAMWVAPLRTLGGVLALSLEYAAAPGDATTGFFRGALVDDPGAPFYPVALFYRITPVAMLGVLLALAPWRRRAGEASPALTWALLAYTMVYLVLVTLSAKKFDRYMLPALLALDVVAALGWSGALIALGDALGRRSRRWRRWAGALLACATPALGVVQASALLVTLPLSYALAWHNPLAGGLRGAMETLPVGWGEGVEQAARYLAAQPDASEARVVTWAVAGVAPFFPGPVDRPTDLSLPNADYLVVTVGDVQGQTPLATALADQEPVFVAHVGGQPYVWVYRNTVGETLARAVDEAASPGDAIVLNAPSAFERQYRGRLPWAVVTGDDAAVLRGLTAATRDARDVYYVAYHGQPSHEAIRRLLARHGLLLDQRPFAATGGQGALYHYRPLAGRWSLRPTTLTAAAGAIFGGELALDEYGLSSGAIEYRQELGVALEWRTLAPAAHDYHASIRLMDADGRTWGQHDAPLEDGAGLRTSAWEVGTRHLADLAVTVEPGTPPGQYRAILSLYRLDNLQRVPVHRGDQARAYQLDLGAVGVRPATAPPRAEDLAIPHPAVATLGEGVQLLGYALSRDVVPSGEEVVVTLYWRCLDTPDGDYDASLRVLAEGREVGRSLARPAGDGHPTDRWRPGEVLRYAHAVRIDPEAPGGEYQLVVSLAPRGGEAPAADDVTLTTLTVEGVERLFEPPEIAFAQAARFGATPGDPTPSIALLGYDLDAGELAPGEALHLTLYWRALRAGVRPYTVFVHLVDEGDVVRGQRDSEPASGRRPISGWLEGEVIVDAYDVALAEGAPAGSYRIAIGLYDPATGERLPVADAAGRDVPDARLLLNHLVAVRR